MIGDRDTPKSGSLRVELTEEVSAYALQGLISLLNNSYFDWLYLSLAEHSSSSTPFPDDWLPDANQELWIRRVEIGTPNFLELLGDFAALQYVHDLISTIVSTGIIVSTTAAASSVAVLNASKAYLNIQKAEEIRKKKSLVPRAVDLQNKRKITEQARRMKEATQPPVEHIVAAAALIKGQELKDDPTPHKS